MEVLVGILLAIVVIIIVLALSDMVADEYVYYDGDTDWLETLFGPLSAKERSIIMPGIDYIVSVEWEGESLSFACNADDSDHAREQAENAYPGCLIGAVEYAHAVDQQEERRKRDDLHRCNAKR